MLIGWCTCLHKLPSSTPSLEPRPLMPLDRRWPSYLGRCRPRCRPHQPRRGPPHQPRRGPVSAGLTWAARAVLATVSTPGLASVIVAVARPCVPAAPLTWVGWAYHRLAWVFVWAPRRLTYRRHLQYRRRRLLFPLPRNVRILTAAAVLFNPSSVMMVLSHIWLPVLLILLQIPLLNHTTMRLL